MKYKTYPSKKNVRIIIVGILVVILTTSNVIFAHARWQATSTPTPTLITGVLTCDIVAAGVTCTDYGSYLDYSINIVVTGLTGGTTASEIFIGKYKRSTNGGYMGVMSNFLHSETSSNLGNTVFSMVAIHPFDAGAETYASFTSSPGTNVNVTNQTSDWRNIGGTGGWPNTLVVKGNVDWAITGYSIVGHIYLYSNQNFAAPTFTPTATPTPSSYTLNLQPDAANGLDTLIHNAAATTNYGTSTTLSIGEINNQTNKITRSLIKFNLSSIPANATITSATMSLWTAADWSSTTRNINVYRLKRPFTETQATWNIAQTGINWQTAGASGANDRETTSIGSVQILANEPLNTQKQISLDPAKIQEFVNGAFTNNGFILIVNTELNDRFDYKSSDNTTAAQRPKLVINYTVPFMTATPTVTPTLTPTNTPTNTITPIAGGTGVCWVSGPAWPVYTVYYDIDTSSKPSAMTVFQWVAEIEAAAQTWSNVSPSHFTFVRQLGSSNIISYEQPDNPNLLAGTAAGPEPYYTYASTKINPLKAPFDILNPPTNGAVNLQNLMAHEFGHWLYLDDLATNTGCNDAMMYYAVVRGNGTVTVQVNLSNYDENGINYKYP